MDQSPAVNIAETPPERLHAEQHNFDNAEPRRLSTILEDILAELRRANTGSASSVEVKTSARGTDVTCKAYAGSDIRPAGDAAVDEYMRVGEMLERRLMGVPDVG